MPRSKKKRSRWSLCLAPTRWTKRKSRLRSIGSRRLEPNWRKPTDECCSGFAWFSRRNSGRRCRNSFLRGPVLVEHNLQPDWPFFNLDRVELGLVGELLKFGPRVSSLQQHEAKCELGDHAVYRAQMHFLHRVTDLRIRSIPSKIDDQRAAA